MNLYPMKCIWLGYMDRIHWGICKCITFQYVLFHRKFWVVQKTCTCWAMPASLGLAFASCYIMNNFSTRMQIRGKIGFTVTPLQGIISLQNFAPATAVHLSCHVHNFIAITCTKLHHLSIEFELWLKNCLWNGPQVCVALLASEGHLAPFTQIYIRCLTGCSRPLATLEAVHLNNLVQRELNVDFFLPSTFWWHVVLVCIHQRTHFHKAVELSEYRQIPLMCSLAGVVSNHTTNMALRAILS